MFRFKYMLKEYQYFFRCNINFQISGFYSQIFVSLNHASLEECPAGLVMVPQPYFAASRHDFITNTGAQILTWIDMFI